MIDLQPYFRYKKIEDLLNLNITIKDALLIERLFKLTDKSLLNLDYDLLRDRINLELSQVFMETYPISKEPNIVEKVERFDFWFDLYIYLFDEKPTEIISFLKRFKGKDKELANYALSRLSN
jgi:hypothetical protein